MRAIYRAIYRAGAGAISYNWEAMNKQKGSQPQPHTHNTHAPAHTPTIRTTPGTSTPQRIAHAHPFTVCPHISPPIYTTHTQHTHAMQPPSQRPSPGADTRPPHSTAEHPAKTAPQHTHTVPGPTDHACTGSNAARHTDARTPHDDQPNDEQTTPHRTATR
jgi:hypothetical protein